ncbi:hypothetical protein Tco_1497650 [Tanacetum coccineum]
MCDTKTDKEKCEKELRDVTKTINEERQIQALVDKKKVVITKATIRSDLHLDDAEGIECLLNAKIFEQLTLMGYENLTQKLTFYKAYFSLQWKFLVHTILQCISAKTTAWNEFSSTIASAIICLATNKKFNFSKYIFDSMMKHLEGGVKFLMFPRFVQVFLDKQGFSGRVTPLFATMMVQAPQAEEEDTEIPETGGPTESMADETEEHIPLHSNDPPLSGEDRLKLTELIEICTNLQ